MEKSVRKLSKASILIDEDTKKTEETEKAKKTKPSKDDVYCKALAKTLDNTECPVTVGLFAPWGRGKDVLLKKIENYLFHKASPKQINAKSTILKLFRTIPYFVKLIFLMIFCHPNPTQKQSKSWEKHYIFIRFSAWEHADSDHVWTGLITNLCEHIENEFGILPISIYRALDGNNKIENEEEKEEKEEKGEENKSLWINKKFMGFPLWQFTFLVIFLAALALGLFLIVGFQFVDHLQTFTSIVEGVGFTILGISLKLPIIRMFETLKNSIFTQKVKIQRKLNRTDMSSKLEFINDVKKEVEVLIDYLHFIETFKKRKIRVVMEITKLDICTPNKVVGVLNAMNILLSDPKAPFISILAVDPGIIVQCVEKSDELKGMANNGYQYLNRVVVLPFYIPEMDNVAKSDFLGQWKEGIKAEKKKNKPEEQNKPQTTHKDKCYNSVPSEETSEHPLSKSEVENLIEQAFKYISSFCEKKYIDDNFIHMKRFVNTLSISIKLMLEDESLKDPHKSQKDPHESPKEPGESLKLNEKLNKLVKWVLLTTQWPCRMSWIMQVVEDENQRMKSKDQRMKLKSDKTKHEEQKEEIKKKTLWEVFVAFLEPLDNMKTCLKNLLEMDGDPEIFQKLLCDDDDDDKLTFGDASTFIPITVNLDHSMKRQMELLLGSYNLLKFKTEEKLTPWCLLNMNTEDICRKMKEIFLQENREDIKGPKEKDKKKAEEDEKKAEEDKKKAEGDREKEIKEYQDRIRKNRLNGRAIVCSDNKELCNALQMKMGDWTTFCLYFLNLPTPKIGYSPN